MHGNDRNRIINQDKGRKDQWKCKCNENDEDTSLMNDTQHKENEKARVNDGKLCGSNYNFLPFRFDTLINIH